MNILEQRNSTIQYMHADLPFNISVQNIVVAMSFSMLFAYSLADQGQPSWVQLHTTLGGIATSTMTFLNCAPLLPTSSIMISIVMGSHVMRYKYDAPGGV